jgi:hypothetical protein
MIGHSFWNCSSKCVSKDKGTPNKEFKGTEVEKIWVPGEWGYLPDGQRVLEEVTGRKRIRRRCLLSKV